MDQQAVGAAVLGLVAVLQLVTLLKGLFIKDDPGKQCVPREEFEEKLADFDTKHVEDRIRQDARIDFLVSSVGDVRVDIGKLTTLVEHAIRTEKK